MPFHDLSLKLMIVMASLILAVRCASVGIVTNATAQVPATPPVLPNPSASESSHGQSVPSDLLDESKLTFLAECNIDSATEQICELYRNLTTILSQRKRDPVTAADINKIITEKADGNRFCDNLSPLLQAIRQKHLDRFQSNRLENRRICEKWCVPFDEATMSMHVKPICKVLLWGFQKELQSEVEEQDPAKQATKVLMPPMLPIGDGQIAENEHAETNPAQPVAAAQSNITLPENTGKASPPKNTENDRTKASSDTAAIVSPASQTTATSAPTKPEISLADKNLVDGDDSQDLNELRNQQNLKDMNGNSPSNNLQEEGDADDDTIYETEPQLDETQETSENVQPKLEQEPFGRKKTDSGGMADDQKADAAVQVERVEQEDPFFDQDDSNFFSYFLFMMFVCILCYVAYHNKSKLLALLLEGRRTSSGRGGFNKGRKHTAAYRKLDSNLEEAITSNAAASSRSTSQIIY
ncbi:trans-Golgi network integral membrane protein TGN38-like [Ochlerotatus camptorhynchus]|uniref:trans-Golgi network integral membrane protein TGN38-like n=1 Tax=Ochlerotatus camptorhynchus TaxID=644619 RepID=UPI0031D36D56